jgi:hypothetical protein
VRYPPKCPMDKWRKAMLEKLQRYYGILLIDLSLIGWFCWSIVLLWCPAFVYYGLPHLAFSDLDVSWSAIWVFLALWLIYLLGYWLIKKAPRVSPSIKLAIILAVVGSGAINILVYPIGAIDVFNYIIETKLAYHYGQNPYLVTADAFARDPFARFGFFLDKPLGYGPIWLILSGLPSVLAGFDDLLRSLLYYKAFNLALIVLTGLAIARYQDDENGRWLAAYTVMANPLVLFEGVGNAHNDVMMTLLVIAALLALKRRSWLAAPLLAASAMVKFFTASLAPLFAMVVLEQKWSRAKLILSLVASVALVLGAFAPFWANGAMIGGLDRGIEAYGSLNSVSIYSLVREYLRQRQVSEDVQSLIWWTLGGLFALCALLVMWKLGSDGRIERATVDMLLLFSALLTLLFPWYLIPTVAILALKHDGIEFAFLLVFSALGLVYYPLSAWAWSGPGWSPLQIHLFQALFLTVPVILFLVVRVVHGHAIKRRASTDL